MRNCLCQAYWEKNIFLKNCWVRAFLTRSAPSGIKPGNFAHAVLRRLPARMWGGFALLTLGSYKWTLLTSQDMAGCLFGGGGYTASCETLGSAAQTRLILTWQLQRPFEEDCGFTLIVQRYSRTPQSDLTLKIATLLQVYSYNNRYNNHSLQQMSGTQVGFYICGTEDDSVTWRLVQASWTMVFFRYKRTYMCSHFAKATAWCVVIVYSVSVLYDPEWTLCKPDGCYLW